VGFIKSDKFLTIFLFIYSFVSEVQSLLLSSKSNINHILKKKIITNSHTIPELVTCALDLTMHNLPYTMSYLTANVSMKIPFLSLFLVLG